MDKGGWAKQILGRDFAPITAVEAVVRVVAEGEILTGTEGKGLRVTREVNAFSIGTRNSIRFRFITGIGRSAVPRLGMTSDFLEAVRVGGRGTIDVKVGTLGLELHGVSGATTEPLDIVLVVGEASADATSGEDDGLTKARVAEVPNPAVDEEEVSTLHITTPKHLTSMNARPRREPPLVRGGTGECPSDIFLEFIAISSVDDKGDVAGVGVWNVLRDDTGGSDAGFFVSLPGDEPFELA